MSRGDDATALLGILGPACMPPLAPLHVPPENTPYLISLALCDRAASEKWHTTKAYSSVGAMSALGQKQDMCGALGDVR